jgi:hypothetical protein
MAFVSPGEVRIKNQDVMYGLVVKEFQSALAEVLIYVCRTFGVVVTESYRKKRHPNDLHGTDPVRAIDIRSWCYRDAETVARDINSKWAYDPARPHMKVAVLHDSGQGEHIHLQVHPRTVKANVDY